MNTQNKPKTRGVIYAGSFDPPTKGHLWMIQKAVEQFDDVRVVVGVNPEKKYLFSLKDRCLMLKEITAQWPQVSIQTMNNAFLANFGPEINIYTILRGIRSAVDYEYERQMNIANLEINNKVTSLYLMPPPELVNVSSSFVKNLIGPHGWELEIYKYIPKQVMRFVLEHGSKLYKLLAAGGVNPSPEAERLFWQTIASHYINQPKRYYHNFIHVARMLKDFHEHCFIDPYINGIEPIVGIINPLALELAIWFHDIEYKAGDPDNEIKSARLAETFLSGADSGLVDKVTQLILATRHTIPPKEKDVETSLIIDLDLSILGADPAVFDAYEENIRKEYSALSFSLFARGRIDFLHMLLKRPHIFTNQSFYAKYETAARSNIKRSIKRLAKFLT